MSYKLLIVFVTAMLTVTAWAQSLIPIEAWTVDMSKPSAKSIYITRGESVDIRPSVTYNGAWNFPAGTTVEMNYKSTDMTNTYYTVAGSVYNATGGVLTVPWRVAQEASAKAYSFEIKASTGSVAAIRITGSIFLRDSLTTLASTTTPTASMLIDWQTVSNLNLSSAPWNSSSVDTTARAMAGSNTERIVTIEGGTSNWYAAYAHTTESSNTVHGGFIKTAYDWATNAYAYAGRAWDQATNALAVAQIVHAWGDHADAGYVTGDVVRAESDPIWAAVSNAVTQGAAAGQAHAATEHRVEGGGGFSGGVGALAWTGGGAVGYGANADAGGAVGNEVFAETGGAVGHAATSTVGGAVGRLAVSVGGGAVGKEAVTVDGGSVGSNAVSSAGGAVGQSAKTSDGFAGGKNAYAAKDVAGNIGDGIDAVQLGSGWNTNPLSLQVYSFTMMLPDGTIPLARMAGVTNGAALGATALQPASTNGWTVTSHDGLVPTNRTITVNGATGTLSSNVVFDIPITNAAYMESSTNFVITVSNGLTWVDAGASTGFVFRFTLPGGGSTNVFLP